MCGNKQFCSYVIKIKKKVLTDYIACCIMQVVQQYSDTANKTGNTNIK